MSPGNRANGERHGEHGKAERQRNAENADTALPGREHGGAAPTEHEPECAERLRRHALGHARAWRVHDRVSHMWISAKRVSEVSGLTIRLFIGDDPRSM